MILMSGNSIVFGEEIGILVFLNTHVSWALDYFYKSDIWSVIDICSDLKKCADNNDMSTQSNTNREQKPDYKIDFSRILIIRVWIIEAPL